MSISRQRLWQDRIATIRHYYKSPRFALIDLAFGLVSLFMNPYRTCRKFLQKKREKNIYAYGETPIATYARIAQLCEIGPQDTWIELGAGRGKGCFWLAHFIKCKVRGIEWIPSFVYLARAIRFLSRLKNLSFERSDIEKTNLNGATILYLYGLWPGLKIPPGVRVITISEPLPHLTLIKKFWVRFPWGRTEAFYQICSKSDDSL